MNSNDCNNCYFLLSNSSEQLAEWAHTVGEDDLEYAIGILEQYNQTLDSVQALLAKYNLQ